MPFRRETFAFDESRHPAVVDWLNGLSRGKKSQAIVEAIEQRAQVPAPAQILAKLDEIHADLRALPGRLGMEAPQ